LIAVDASNRLPPAAADRLYARRRSAAGDAAAREHAERYVTLKHKNSVINRWNAPSH